MTCGLPKDCKEYNNYLISWKIATIVIILVYLVFISLWRMVRACNKNSTCCETLLLTFYIIFPPLLLIMLIRSIVRRNRMEAKLEDLKNKCAGVNNNQRLSSAGYDETNNNHCLAIPADIEKNEVDIIHAEKEMIIGEKNIIADPSFLSE
jgi:hypothetical protein